MARATHPWPIIGWLGAHGEPDTLAGAAFLIGPDIVLTCAHVIRDHLGLGKPTPTAPPPNTIRIRFEALGCETAGKVLAAGWFPDSARSVDGLSDIAAVRLRRRMNEVVRPGIAAAMQNTEFDAWVYGAEPGFQTYGQVAKVKISGSCNLAGWRALDHCGSAFTVERGFSGAPVMDELGNVVWGMVAAVDGSGRAAFAITADDLRSALRRIGDTNVRIADKVDADAREAMAALRQQVEIMQTDTKQKESEIAQLRELVRALSTRERDTGGSGPERGALQSLAQGDSQPTVEILRGQIRAQRVAAAVAGRQLGALLSLTDSREALLAYREAASLDPDDTWTLIALGDHEYRVGSLSRAGEAYQRARARSERLAAHDPGNAEWQRDLAGALNAYRDGMGIAERLAAHDPGNAEWQRDLSVKPQQDRRCAAGAGRSRRRAQRLPGRHGHSRTPGRARSRQRHVAARPG